MPIHKICDRLYVAARAEVERIPRRQITRQFQCVCDVAAQETTVTHLPRGKSEFQYALFDGPSADPAANAALFCSAAATVAVRMKAREWVLLYCDAGVSRSPAVAMLSLVYLGEFPNTARQQVEARLPRSQPHPFFLRILFAGTTPSGGQIE